MEYEYFYVAQVNGTIQIEDPGNCTIQANNDDGASYYLIIETWLGITRIFEYGPTRVDVDRLLNKVTCNFTRLNYNDLKINKAIDSFLNNPHRGITSAYEITKEEALNNCKSIINYMKVEED